MLAVWTDSFRVSHTIEHHHLLLGALFFELVISHGGTSGSMVALVYRHDVGRVKEREAKARSIAKFVKRPQELRCLFSVLFSDNATHATACCF